MDMGAILRSCAELDAHAVVKSAGDRTDISRTREKNRLTIYLFYDSNANRSEFVQNRVRIELHLGDDPPALGSQTLIIPGESPLHTRQMARLHRSIGILF